MLSDATEREQEEGAESRVRKERWETGAGNAERRKQSSQQRTRETNRTAAAEAGKEAGERLVAWRGHTSRGLCCVCVFLVLACLHMLWATARLGSARAAAAATTAAAAAAVAAVSNLCAIETYEMQKCSPEKQQQQQQQIKHEAQQ